MILAAAQTNPKRGDIESNLIDHYNLIELASKNQVDLIVFPEMSITRYEIEYEIVSFNNNRFKIG